MGALSGLGGTGQPAAGQNCSAFFGNCTAGSDPISSSCFKAGGDCLFVSDM